MFLRLHFLRNSLVVRWLGLHTFTSKGVALIPGGWTKILPAAMQHSQKKKKKIYIF